MNRTPFGFQGGTKKPAPVAGFWIVSEVSVLESFVLALAAFRPGPAFGKFTIGVRARVLVQFISFVACVGNSAGKAFGNVAQRATV